MATNEASMANSATPPEAAAPVRVPVLLFGVSVAVIIANVFAPQTLVKLMSTSFGLTAAMSGFVPMVPLIGYAIGLFFLVPLADLVENRRLVLAMISAAALSSLGVALTSSVPLLFALLFVVGAGCSVIQVLIPSAAAMTPPERRGRVIGDIMSGLMIGILLSRPMGSFLSSFGGWKTYYFATTILMTGLAATLAFRLPVRRIASGASYARLIGSLWHLFRSEPVLRKRSFTAAIVMAAFNVYWTTIVYLLTAPPFNLGPRGVAFFALAGAGGAIVTPTVGRLADKGFSKRVTFVSHVVLIAGFGVAALSGLNLTAPWFICLLGLALGAFMLDVGVLGDQTVGRYLINLLNPEARGRINGIFVGFGDCWNTLGVWRLGCNLCRGCRVGSARGSR
ncbi:MAG TPA: MFS transporter [Verrucomicrobiae bacterium]|jgi:predicted MFS family arabinose efflux permease